MKEQNVNKNIASVLMHKIRGFGIVCIAAAALVLSACMPQGEDHINTTLFKDKEEMKTKTAQLKTGMNKKSAFEAVGIPPEKFDRMTAEEVQGSVYGNSVVQGTPEQLEQFKQRLLAYEGYSLPYRMIKSDSSLGFGKMKINKTGQDLHLVLIFENNKLLRATVEGREEVSEQQDEYLWSSLLKKGLAFAF